MGELCWTGVFVSSQGEGRYGLFPYANGSAGLWADLEYCPGPNAGLD